MNLKRRGMVQIAFSGLALVTAGLVQAEDKPPMQPPLMQAPVLLPSEVVNLAEDYLVQVKKIPRNSFRVSDVGDRKSVV